MPASPSSGSVESETFRLISPNRASQESQRDLGLVVGSFDHIHHSKRNVGVNARLVGVELRSLTDDFTFKNKLRRCGQLFQTDRQDTRRR